MQPFVVRDLSTYLELIYGIGAGSTNHLWFRGQTKACWPVQPSIQREFEDFLSDRKEFHEHERYYTNDFQHTASVFLSEKPALDDFSSWLTLMQHYGLPTRLLDWSRSALFALYFAIVDQSYINDIRYEVPLVDGAVWLLNPFMLNVFAQLEPHPYLYHMEHWTIRYVVHSAFRSGLDREFRADQDYRTRSKAWGKFQDCVVACYATQCDPRVANQQSAFTVHSSLRPLEEIDAELRASGRSPLLEKIIIPADCKPEMAEALYMSGITHSTVFPDLEHVALDIRRFYGKKR